MIKLLKANLARLWKNKVFLVRIFGVKCFCIIQKIGLIQDTIEVHYLEETFWIQAYVLGIILSVFISLFIGAEYEYGTIRNKIISGYDRSRNLSCKYICLYYCGMDYVHGVSDFFTFGWRSIFGIFPH